MEGTPAAYTICFGKGCGARLHGDGKEHVSLMKVFKNMFEGGRRVAWTSLKANGFGGSLIISRHTSLDLLDSQRAEPW